MASLHHLELLVRDGRSFVQKLAKQYLFKLIGHRKTSNVSQWVIRAGDATFLVTEPDTIVSDGQQVPCPSHAGLSRQMRYLSNGIDTVFDVGLKVKDITRLLQNAREFGVEILRPLTRAEDDDGYCETAVIKSCVGNVVHTLINRSGYRGTFLPGFNQVDSSLELPNSRTTFVKSIDHLTVVCEQGEVDGVLRWYENVFGFSRFFMNRSESDREGFVLDGNIGLRLKAMEYFYCAEKGLCNRANDGDVFKLVVAESLPGHDATTNQIDSFLKHHHGGGVQHVGFCTEDIIAAVDHCRQMGVQLQIPPVMYFHHIGKLEEIKNSGEDLDRLRHYGILLDAEVDESYDEASMFAVVVPYSKSALNFCTFCFRRYLKQIFTKPIFDKPTFFLEFIERRGARGFGTGNIAALWWSAQQPKHQSQSTEIMTPAPLPTGLAGVARASEAMN